MDRRVGRRRDAVKGGLFGLPAILCALCLTRPEPEPPVTIVDGTVVCREHAADMLAADQ